MMTNLYMKRDRKKCKYIYGDLTLCRNGAEKGDNCAAHKGKKGHAPCVECGGAYRLATAVRQRCRLCSLRQAARERRAKALNAVSQAVAPISPAHSPKQSDCPQLPTPRSLLDDESLMLVLAGAL